MPTCAIACNTFISVCVCMHVRTHFTHSEVPALFTRDRPQKQFSNWQSHNQLTLTFLRGVPDFPGDKEPAEVTELTLAGLLAQVPCLQSTRAHWVGSTGTQTAGALSILSMLPTPPPGELPTAQRQQEPLSPLRAAEPGHCWDHPTSWGIYLCDRFHLRMG